MTGVTAALIALILLHLLSSLVGFGYALYNVPLATRKHFGSCWLGIKLTVTWYVWFLIGLLVEIVGFIIAPVVVLFADHTTGRLPRGFHWMETHDALLPGYPATQNFNRATPTNWWSYYWQSLCWLSRNRTYRFSAEQMGVLCVAGEQRVTLGSTAATNHSPGVTGFYVVVSDACFELKHVWLLFGTYWELRAGYKMRASTFETGYAQHVFRIRPGDTL